MSGTDDAFTCIPALVPALQAPFGGPHTQFAAAALYTPSAEGGPCSCVVAVTCTQVFVCDADGYVVRTALLEKLLALHARTAGDTTELLLVFDGEHDLLLHGALRCDGTPAKALLPTLRALHRCHRPGALAVHDDEAVPLRELAQLRPPPEYVAPQPRPEEDFAACPCWREADVLRIADAEFVRRVTNLLAVHAPAKVPTAPELCRRYAKRKGAALRELVATYGAEPSDDEATAALRVVRREQQFAQFFAPEAVPEPAARPAGRLKFSDGDLHFPALLLMRRPTGGAPRVRVRVTPVETALPPEPHRAFRRRELSPETEHWALCSEGYLVALETAPDVMWPFGYAHGDRVAATFGPTAGARATVLGVRAGVLWVQEDGAPGATAMVGFASREELERAHGWVVAGNAAVPEPTHLPFLAAAGHVVSLRVAPEATLPICGLCHGEQAESPMGTVTMVGVDQGGAAYVATGDDRGVVPVPGSVPADFSDWHVVGTRRLVQWTGL